MTTKHSRDFRLVVPLRMISLGTAVVTSTLAAGLADADPTADDALSYVLAAAALDDRDDRVGTSTGRSGDGGAVGRGGEGGGGESGEGGGEGGGDSGKD